jgi:hypothetical protein
MAVGDELEVSEREGRNVWRKSIIRGARLQSERRMCDLTDMEDKKTAPKE